MSRIRADRVTNRAGTGAPLFPNGAQVTGVITATTFDGNATTATTATSANGLTGTPNIVVGSVTGTTGSFSGDVSIGGTLTYEDVTNIDSVGLITARSGIRVTGGYTDARGIIENVSAASTYMHDGAMYIEMDVQAATTYTYTNIGGNIGVVSFKNLPADAQGGTTITLLHTQNSTTPAGGIGNTQPAVGLGTNVFITPYVNGASQTGISTRNFIGSGTTVVLSGTASDRDFVSFFLHYTGGTNTDAASYNVYVTKVGNFRRGGVGI